jgi:hypothetical protein
MALVGSLGCSTGGSRHISIGDVSDGEEIKWLRVELKNGEEHTLEDPQVVADSLIGSEWPPDDPKGVNRNFKSYHLKGYPKRVAVPVDSVRTIELMDAKERKRSRKAFLVVLVPVALAIVVGLIIFSRIDSY